MENIFIGGMQHQALTGHLPVGGGRPYGQGWGGRGNDRMYSLGRVMMMGGIFNGGFRARRNRLNPFSV